MSEFWDTADGWDNWLADQPDLNVGGYDSTPGLNLGVPPPPAQPDLQSVTPDGDLMVYAGIPAHLFTTAGEIGDKPYFNVAGAAPAVTGSVSGAPGAPGKVDDTSGDSMMARLAKAMGFDNTKDFAKVMGPAAVTLAGSLVAGAASGYGKAQEAKIAKQLADSKALVDQSTIAYNQSKTNQAGLANLKYGMINAPFKPPKIIPVGQRALA